MIEEKTVNFEFDEQQDKRAGRPAEQLIALLSPLVEPLGYEIVHLEIVTHRQKTLRLYIDHLTAKGEAIGVEDCARVSRALDEPLDAMSEVDAVFHGASYELEVSSPGVDRPLRQAKDYERFLGREARIHVFRPLTPSELENPGYQEKNPKQKNFLGVLKGMRDGKVLLSLSKDRSSKGSKKRKADSAEPTTNSGDEVMIPLSLISKANLEPKFEFDEKE